MSPKVTGKSKRSGYQTIRASWIEKYYDEERDVLVLSNREQKLGTNGHWAEREIWVED